MVNVFLEASPSPVKSAMLMGAFRRLVGATAGRRLLQVSAAPGRSLSLFPDAGLPFEFRWTFAEERIAGAVARFAATIESHGARAVPVSVRELVSREIDHWDGEDPRLSLGWLTSALQPIHTYAEHAAARLALVTAFASYSVDLNTVARFRQHYPSEAQIVAVTAWARRS